MKPTVENRPKKGGSYPPEFREEAVRHWHTQRVTRAARQPVRSRVSWV